MQNINISDFDNTLFERNFGLIEENVRYLEQKALPVYIVTYRASNQFDFIMDTLGGTKLNIIGIAFAESRKKDPQTKIFLVDLLLEHYNIVEALDDDRSLVVPLSERGIKVTTT